MEDESFHGGRGQILPPFPEVCKSSLGMPTFKWSMSIIYRIFSIKRRPRIKAAYKRKIINKRGTQSEQCGVYLKIYEKLLYIFVIYIIKTITILSQQKNKNKKQKNPKNKASRWNSYKHISVYIIHVIYRGHLRNVIM